MNNSMMLLIELKIETPNKISDKFYEDQIKQKDKKIEILEERT